jgi:hypothetical protein
MKTLLITTVVCLSLLNFSCKKEATDNHFNTTPALDKMITGTTVNNSTGINNTRAVYSIYTRVGLYNNGDNDETVQFKGYVFEFRSDNSTIIHGESGNIYGRWIYELPGNLEFNFNFFIATYPGLGILNGNWTIVEMNDNSMLLSCPVNGSGQVEKLKYLRFDLVK